MYVGVLDAFLGLVVLEIFGIIVEVVPVFYIGEYFIESHVPTETQT